MLEREEVFSYTRKCFSGELASCSFACPFKVDIRSLMKKCAKGRFPAALTELATVLPFPGLISEICPHPCETFCQRAACLGDEAVSVKEIEQACVTFGKKKERAEYKLPYLDQNVAIVGAGAVGLALALHLDRKRFHVTVFEQSETWGGRLKTDECFPAFEEEFEQKFAGTSVEFVYQRKIETTEELTDYDAVAFTVPFDPSLDAAGNVFYGGGENGSDQLAFVQSIADTMDVAREMEAFLQTGNRTYIKEKWDKENCRRYAPHNNEEKKERIKPANGRYTKEEVQAEAARCMLCDCDACMNACELLQTYKKKPPRIANDVASDGQTRNSVSSATITRQTWSCNHCGRCASVCEEAVDLSGLFELSRCDRVASRAYPPAFHGYYLEEMEKVIKEAGMIRPAAGYDVCQTAFFPGCRLGGSNPEYILKSYEELLKDDPSCGIFLNCCGIPALWAGEKEKFEKHIAFIRSEWERIGRPKLICACESCRKTLGRFLPETETISLYTVLKAESTSSIAPKEVAVFDPCAAQKEPDVKEAVRTLLDGMGLTVSDYDNTGKCCGFGGHMNLANPELFDTITQNRCAETELPYVAYCVNCADVFRTHGKECVHVLDLFFGLTTGYATLDEKAENNKKAKKTLLKKYWMEEMEETTAPWNSLQIKAEDSIINNMEKNLIPMYEIRRLIWENEEEQGGFEMEDGTILCSRTGDYVTYWVKYCKEENEIVLKDVYTHRMTIRGEGSDGR